MFFNRYSFDKAELDALRRSYAVIRFSPDGNILDANENFLNAVGYKLEEIKGQHHKIFCDADYAQSHEYKKFWQRLAAGECFTAQYKRYAKGGREIWIEASYCPIVDQDGKVASVVKYATDITSRQYQFADYEGQLAAISRSQAVIEFNMDGTIITANPNFCATVGYTLDEIRGRHHSMFVDPTYAKSAEYKNFWERLNKGEHFVAEYQRFGKGGKEIWISASYNPILDMNGRPFKMVKYATDITARKLKYADYEGQLAAINRSQAVIEFNMDGTIITANPNFCATVGYSLDEIKGKHHRMFVDPEYANSYEYKEFWERLNKGEHFVAEYQRFGKGGKEIWISASYNPILDANGRPFKMVKYATDITKQKLAAADARWQLDAISKAQAIIEFELDGTIVSANKNFLDAMGYTLGEIRGQHHRMFVDPQEAKSKEYAEFWERLGRGEFDARVFKRITKSGKEIWIQASYNPIFDAKGHPFKVVKYATDITKVIETARIAEEVVANTQSVAAAVEQMTAAIGEISNNVQLTKEAASVIVKDSSYSSAAAEQLGASMKVMENVVQLIGSIAGQVNLLAVNATIEAARAGEAGKGFAVVAAEVKNLANQTTEATEKIAKQIQDVQSVSIRVAESIHTITNSANNVNDYITDVAHAINEQSSVTKDISENTMEMAGAVEDIARRIKGLASVKKDHVA